MIRLLFWIAVIFIGLWVWRKIKAGAAAKAHKPAPHTLTMVRCAQCGVHLPDDRAIRRDQHWYCSQAHLEQGPRAQ